MYLIKSYVLQLSEKIEGGKAALKKLQNEHTELSEKLAGSEKQTAKLQGKIENMVSPFYS